MSPDGVMHGWLRDRSAATPCHVQILQHGVLLAEAIAGTFRADLLRAGHGHGHYGFQARLRETLPPGPCSVSLHLPRTGIAASMAMTVPALEPPRPRTIELLLAAEPGWTTAELLERPACLDMAANLAAMGEARFVDGLFRFVLGRWPSGAESRLHAGGLRAGRVTPHELFVDMLSSRERADMAPALASPYDPDFPFSAEGVP